MAQDLTSSANQASGFSIDAAEVEQFSKQAHLWWDEKGPFAPLHKFNPTRVAYIRDTALGRFERSFTSLKPFEGLSLLDVGCGGGLLSEPMARIGFAVTGLDASDKNIGTASLHAKMSGLEITYLSQTVEQLESHNGPLFDVVLCMEVIEHVADPEAFLQACARRLKPGGMMVCATLNRTLKAFALAIVGAEYVLSWLPKGTHDWNKFLKPEALSGFLAPTPLEVHSTLGITYNPLSDRWALSDDVSVNYMMTAFCPKETV
jgi:2-polyprenyl-6-hydroxyphenyl methylase / 3-demethylubiquinone-9 3-methyltransferase